MKTRDGFVSNSSTSSFTCEVCGANYAERDASLCDAEMYRCIDHGHTFCDSHVVGNPEEEDYESRYETPTKCCPICSMAYLTPEQEAQYLRKKAGYTDTQATLKAVLAEFPTYDEFTTWLNHPAIKDGKP